MENIEKPSMLWLWTCVDPRISNRQDESWAFETFDIENVQTHCEAGPESVLHFLLSNFKLDRQYGEGDPRNALSRIIELFEVTLVLIGHEGCKGYPVKFRAHVDKISRTIDTWREKCRTPAYGAIRRLDNKDVFGPPELLVK